MMKKHWSIIAAQAFRTRSEAQAAAAVWRAHCKHTGREVRIASRVVKAFCGAAVVWVVVVREAYQTKTAPSAAESITVAE